MDYRVIQKNEHCHFADIHLDAFNGFFLSSLGKKFLNVYYNAATNSNETIAICAIDNEGQIQGFCTGCVKSKGFHKRLILHNPLAFLYQGLIILLTNPKSLIRLALNLDKISFKNDNGNYAELISIGVSHAYKGLGIGNKLIKIFEEEATRKGCRKISLTTDAYNNEDVVAFYKHLGYKVFYEFTAYPNRKMYKFIKNIAE